MTENKGGVGVPQASGLMLRGPCPEGAWEKEGPAGLENYEDAHQFTGHRDKSETIQRHSVGDHLEGLLWGAGLGLSNDGGRDVFGE